MPDSTEREEDREWTTRRRCDDADREHRGRRRRQHREEERASADDDDVADDDDASTRRRRGSGAAADALSFARSFVTPDYLCEVVEQVRAQLGMRLRLARDDERDERDEDRDHDALDALAREHEHRREAAPLHALPALVPPVEVAVPENPS